MLKFAEGAKTHHDNTENDNRTYRNFFRDTIYNVFQDKKE